VNGHGDDLVVVAALIKGMILYLVRFDDRSRRRSAMIFRLSQKLNAKIKAGPLVELPPDGNPFADWSAHLFAIGRTQYILVSNTKSLYSTVMPAKGINDDSTFIERVLENLREFLADDNQQFAFRQWIAPGSGTIQFAKALNRTITSSMNELILSATAWLEEGVSPYEVGFRLNTVLLSAIAPNKKAKFGVPREAFKMMIEAQAQ
jgi:hypothetical protein